MPRSHSLQCAACSTQQKNKTKQSPGVFNTTPHLFEFARMFFQKDFMIYKCNWGNDVVAVQIAAHARRARCASDASKTSLTSGLRAERTSSEQSGVRCRLESARAVKPLLLDMHGASLHCNRLHMYFLCAFITKQRLHFQSNSNGEWC